MGIRMTLRGREERKPEQDQYAEGYNAGYHTGVEEARREGSRGFAAPLHEDHYPSVNPDMLHEADYSPPMDPELRRGRRARSDYSRFPVERLPIGFRDNSREHPGREQDMRGSMDAMMEMLEGLMERHERLEQGLAQSAKKLDPRLDAVLESATGVLDRPPATWVPYMHKKDYAGIVKMEGKELLAALEAHKPITDIRKELTHTLAALFQLLTK